MKRSPSGFLVLDHALKAIYANEEAIRILMYPETRRHLKSLKSSLAPKIRASLANHLAFRPEFETEFTSGRRCYQCKSFAINLSPYLPTPARGIALVLERASRSFIDVAHAAERYHLSPRESEAVLLLVHGLSTPEIAKRMKVSPNTVKSFLRLSMLKMGVTRRAGIIGAIFARQSSG